MSLNTVAQKRASAIQLLQRREEDVTETFVFVSFASWDVASLECKGALSGTTCGEDHTMYLMCFFTITD